jgi:hypothetical protein
VHVYVVDVTFPRVIVLPESVLPLTFDWLNTPPSPQSTVNVPFAVIVNVTVAGDSSVAVNEVVVTENLCPYCAVHVVFSDISNLAPALTDTPLHDQFLKSTPDGAVHEFVAVFTNTPVLYVFESVGAVPVPSPHEYVTVLTVSVDIQETLEFHWLSYPVVYFVVFGYAEQDVAKPVLENIPDIKSVYVGEPFAINPANMVGGIYPDKFEQL